MDKLTREQMEQVIVLERLFASNPDIKFAVITAQGPKTYTRADIIEEVKHMTPFGKKYVEDQMQYTRDLASGKILTLLEEIDNL